MDEAADETSTATAIERFQSGDRDAFAELYSRYFDRVYSYLRLLLRDRHGAEDAAQHVFAQAYEALPAYEHRHSFSVWLFRIVRNHAINELKKRNRLEVEDPEAIARHRERNGEDTNAAEAPELTRALSWISDRDLLIFIERLPLSQRQVLVLRYLFDLSNREIAEVIDRSPTDVSLLHHRATLFLRKRLRAIGRDPGSAKPAQWRRRPIKAVVARSRRFALDP